MKKIPLTKEKFALVDDDDYEKVKRFKWHFTNHGYAKHNEVYLHRLITGVPKGLEVDHRNGNKLDNRKKNLRFADRKINCNNLKISRVNKTGEIGVSWSKRWAKWVVFLRDEKGKRNQGSFQNKEDAALRARNVRKRLSVLYEKRSNSLKQQISKVEIKRIKMRELEKCKEYKPRSSSFRGVNNQGQRWRATIRINGKSKHIGSFKIEKDAALAYDREARAIYGEKAKLNFI